MNIVNNLRSYIMDDEFKITILDKRIDVVNYDRLGHFDNNKVIIHYQKGQVIIKGSNLSVSKLMNDEVLIKGKFNNIEFR